MSAAQAAGKASAPSTAEQRAAAELHGRLAALQRQRCQLRRELQELLADLCGGAAAPAPVESARAGSGALDAFCSPRRRLAPLAPSLLAARVAALGRLQDELLAACQALAADFDAAQQPPGAPPGSQQNAGFPAPTLLVMSHREVMLGTQATVACSPSATTLVDTAHAGLFISS